MKKTLYLILLIAGTHLCGCTTTYTSLNPTTTTPYGSPRYFQDVEYSYHNNFLEQSGDHVIIQHAHAANVQVVAVKITNNGIESMELGKTHFLALEGQPITIMDSDPIYKNLKHRLHYFFPSLLLSPLLGFSALTSEEGEEEVDNGTAAMAFLVGPVSVILGSTFQLAANASFKDDIIRWNLLGKKIDPGMTVYGLIGFEAQKLGDLSLYSLERY